MSFLHKLICKVSAIQGFSSRRRCADSKIYRKGRGPRIAKRPFCKRRMWAESHHPILTLTVKLCCTQTVVMVKRQTYKSLHPEVGAHKYVQLILDSCKGNSVEEDGLFCIPCWSNWTSMCRNRNFSTSPTGVKTNSK